MKDDKFSGDLQAWIEPELEARLVALILGESSDFEREELERLMGERPELAVFKRRLESIDGLVRESVKPEKAGDEDWKLGAEKRAAVMKVLGTPAAKALGESPQPPILMPDRKRNWGRRIRAVAACLVLIVVLGVLTSPFFFGSLKRSANMALATDDARLASEELYESYSEGAAEAAPMDSTAAEIVDHRNLREPTPMAARESPSTPLERGMAVEGQEKAEAVDRSEKLIRSKSNALAQLRANLDHGGLSRPEEPPEALAMLGEDIVFSDADAPNVDSDPFAGPGSGERRLRVDDRDGRGREREALATRGVIDTSGRDFFFAEEDKEGLVAGEGGRTQSTGDVIKPEDFKRVHQAPVEVGKSIGGNVTGGFRSGDAAITRNSIDAILSKPGSVSRKSSADPEVREGPVSETTIVDAVPELTDGGLGLRSEIKTKFVEVSQADEKELGFDWFVDESATKIANGKDAPADSTFETEAKAEDGVAMGDVPLLGGLFERGNARPAVTSRPVAKRQPPGNVGTSEANIAGYETLESQVTEEVRYKIDDSDGRPKESPTPDNTPATEPTPPILALSDGESFGDGWKSGSGGGGGGFNGNAPEDATLEVEWQKNVPRVKVPTSSYTGYSVDEAAARRRNNVDSIPADPFGAPEQAKAEPVGEKNQEGDELRRDLYMSEGYFDLGKFDEAQRHAEAVLDKDPSNEGARRLLEKATAAQSDYDASDRDDSRARLLKEVDEAWESAAPEEPTAAEGEDLGTKVIDVPSTFFDALARSSREDDAEDPFADNSRVSGLKARTPAKEMLENLGVEFPEGASVSFLPGSNKLVVRNTPGNLDLVEAVVQQTKEAEAKKRSVSEDNASEKPFSTFSLHVSDVSFKLAQAALQKGQWPEAARVRTEEFVNAFDYQDPTPTMAEKVGCQIGQAAHPFAQQRNLVRISMRAAALGRGAGTPLRLTVLLDNSGSMDRADRAESVRRAFALLTAQLNENDEVTLISFARTPRLLRDRVSGTELGDLSQVVGQLQSEGGTNLEAALQLGIDKAKASFLAEAQNRIILLTDGAANLGNAEPDTLRAMIENLREQGIAFDACGVGADGLNDEVLESLTRKGDGRYYFLDRPEDADAGFAKQIAGALRPAAQNVKVQVEFNPERVGRYKLYGFEKHELKKEDFRNDSVDAAELAAEEAGVAVYQVQTLPAGKGPVGTVSVRFRDMASGQMVERSWEIPYGAQPARLDEAEAPVRLAGTAALFAERLKGTAVGDGVDLGGLGPTARGLQSLYPNQERIGHIIEMIEQARRLSE